MRDVVLARRPTCLAPRSVAAYLGSFDPPHRGHAFVVEQLLLRFDQVLVLIPTRHFEKRIEHPHNATLAQRLAMLDGITRSVPGRVGIGLTSEVLYLRLAGRLGALYPTATIGFGMGDDSHARFLSSRAYYHAVGLPWGPEQDAALQDLDRRVVVFGRHQHATGSVVVPEHLRSVSSTRVRAAVRDRDEALCSMVDTGTARLIRAYGLYRSEALPRPQSGPGPGTTEPLPAT